MAQYISQMRRGVRYVDDNGMTLLNPDGTPVRDDWTEYTALEYHRNPLESELVVEYEVNPKTGKSLPRLKIGDGESTFAELPYMSVDSFILPKTASVTLDHTKWTQAVTGDDDRYYQVVTVQNATITPSSKVDLTPNAAMLDEFHELDLAFVAENDEGTVSVFCVGQVPTKPYTINVTVTEVVCDG